jgi:hypothetical protein
MNSLSVISCGVASTPEALENTLRARARITHIACQKYLNIHYVRGLHVTIIIISHQPVVSMSGVSSQERPKGRKVYEINTTYRTDGSAD